MELGQAYYEAYSGQVNRLSELQTYAEISEAVLSFQFRDGSVSSLVRLAANLEAADAGWRAYSFVRDAELEKTYLPLALRSFIIARDLCPLLGKPHARLAAHRDLLAKGDRSEAYMERVRYLRQYDPEVWYISGILELAALHQEEAWENWKRSLQLSDAFLMEIVHRSLTFLSVPDLLDKVLPDNPAEVLRAGTELYPMASAKVEREPFIARTLELLDKPGHLLTASERHVKAKALYLAGRPTDALAAYRVAIQYNPTSIDLRLEYANLLHELGFIREARWELAGILVSDKGNARAQEMLNSFERKDNSKER
jgi:tetratricopeptide (TPR) repeat protein